MIIIKTKEEIETLKEGGRILAQVVEYVAGLVRPGVSTLELDIEAKKMIESLGGVPAFLNYQPEGASYPFPNTLCVSINDEVVHGIPKKNRILKEGDIVSIDCGVKYKNLFTDHAVTVAVGKISKKEQELLDITKKSLYAGIEQAIIGNRIGDISFAVQSVIKPYKFGIIKDLSGHGVGKYIHEDPYIPNFGQKGKGILLKEGMVIAIEPMINIGKAGVVYDKDGYTIRTADGSKSAHFEHTVAITKEGPIIMTNG